MQSKIKCLDLSIFASLLLQFNFFLSFSLSSCHCLHFMNKPKPIIHHTLEWIRQILKYEGKETESSLQPLIPTSVLDQASQRLFIVSIFILIQSWKIYDLVLLKSEIPATGEVLTLLSNFTFVLKYSVLDGLFYGSYQF